MNTNDVRTAYLRYFTGRDHVEIPSATLVPENDPTTLFTGSGMQPLLPYLLGKQHPQGTRLVDSQKCFRAEDIEEVGDNRHTTFFEMLGNWSLGDYFKREQLPWFFRFLTEELELDPSRLYVTVFYGSKEAGIDRDAEAAAIWQDLFSQTGISAGEADMISEEQGSERGMNDGERIFYYDASKNWWSRAGAPAYMPAGEPGGPDSEVFYDFGTEHDTAYGTYCHPNCDCGRFLEIGNSVFMEYLKREDGSFSALPQKNVDFGGGLERIAAAVNGTPDVFKIDVLHRLIETVEANTEYSYEDPQHRESFRIIADHIRGAVFMLADGVEPSNAEEGYVARRLLRRSVQHLDRLAIADDVLASLVATVVATYKDQYPELADKEAAIAQSIAAEESKFRETLKHGMKEFERVAQQGEISGQEAFELFATYGFPLEMTLELAQERNISVDIEGFHAEMERHRERSRAGAEQKFKGGLADHSDTTIQYHTATHLLHQALRDVLGNHVHQKGSNITPERLRFDFNFDRKLTDEEIAEVERIVNEKIEQELPVTYEDITLEEARDRGAIGLFDEKYGDVVRVYQIGAPETTDSVYSLEFCGGPHVSNTSELNGTFSIRKEEAVSAGVRRVKAVLT
jgi:alanyl-tRNA synthetase